MKKIMSEEAKKEIQSGELSMDELEKVAGGQITFEPLLNYLKENNIPVTRMIRDGVITATDTTRIRADHNYRLSFVNKLCEYLGCGIGDVISYIPDDVQDNSIDVLVNELQGSF